ncbi:hypothetical protein EV363DRAFT_1317818 [Boletus edulis]|uniref:Uncharacterized protein n=1 Tax=Boletus edulis BED1 TaxID=1328754 RepID=A0AAD4BTA3_BOLED|nr:hypothetical protein EV363DRAFT_1317818 [Boletus edulis]KAF8439125.1 hypothetical protein L210DRAFT_3543539 [Boletus edulis BED1]
MLIDVIALLAEIGVTAATQSVQRFLKHRWWGGLGLREVVLEFPSRSRNDLIEDSNNLLLMVLLDFVWVGNEIQD